MTLLVGFGPQEHSPAAVHLGAMLARSADEDLLVACVAPIRWLPGMARVDAEYRDFVSRTVDAGLARAGQMLPGDVQARSIRHDARSVSSGLLELIEHYQPRTLVLGSSSAGAFGRVALGSIPDRLTHSAPVPVSIAPRGFRAGEESRVRRVTAAYSGDHAADYLVVAAARVAARVGATLRIASFAVWNRPDYTTRLGSEGEDQVMREWLDDLRVNIAKVLRQVDELADVPADVEAVLARGGNWIDAIDDMDWREGDVLAVGSSGMGPVTSVFLGTRSSKIVRHSPVPVVVVPRGSARILADDAPEG